MEGVGKWCLQAARRGRGRFRSEDHLFDVIVIHLDADVADEVPGPGEHLRGLPCAKPCPPAKATTDPLREAMLHWMGHRAVPAKVVLCTPSKATDAWVMEAFFPEDREMRRFGKECHPNPKGRLAQQPKRVRLRGGDYRRQAQEFQASWPRVAAPLTEAGRFQADMESAIEPVLRS